MTRSSHRARFRSRALSIFGSAGLFALAGAGAINLDAHGLPTVPARLADTADTSAVASSAANSATSTGLIDFLDSLSGRSRKLRAAFVGGGNSLRIPVLTRLFGDTVAPRPGVYAVHDSAQNRVFSLITLRPFADKVHGWIGSYHMGFWPEEKRRTPRSEAYFNPDGFIEVTQENQDTYVSEHFRLRDFLTHDQENVWPKYIVLDENLIDKLELVITELDREGHHVEHVTVMSGFRTPEYNIQGVGRGGRAKDSRHQFGDAADIFVDNDGDGRMDDLNHDHRIDYRDARVIEQAVERVEQEHPDLAGGCGVYRSTRAHGPFAHIDARGTRARWGLV
jgi:hypothetical protein